MSQEKVAEDSRTILYREVDQGYNTTTSTTPTLSEILIKQALHEEAIIERMKAAVLAGDRNTVFDLARELTCVTAEGK